MHLNLSDLSANQAYHTLTQTLIPRPVAWVLSDSGNDSLNLALFRISMPSAQTRHWS